MGRLFNGLLLAAMIVGAVVTYQLKREAEIAAADVARLRGEIAAEREAVALLRAEWSMLTQPGRLQTVVEQNPDRFRLAPFSPAQIATIGEIPMRPAGAIELDRDAIARLSAGEPLR
jgi:hypothetical protein